jgi:ketosteroid isomerase-like protein
MSEENVDRFMEAIAAFNRLGESGGDREAVEDYLAFWHPELRFEPQQAVLEGGYVGHAGLRAQVADMARHYDYGHFTFTDVRDLGDRVLGLGVLGVIGRGSGIEIEVPVAIVATFRDGLVSHAKDYGDRRAALEAVGLSE